MLEKIKDLDKKFSSNPANLIKVVKRDQQIINWIDHELQNRFPKEVVDEPLAGKLFLVLNSEVGLFCSHGRKQHYYCKKYICTSSCPCVMEKISATNTKVYGSKNVFENEQIKEKIKETNRKKRNHDYPMQCSEVKEKAIITNLIRYKETSPAKSQKVKDKIRNTNISKYKVDYLLRDENFKKQANQKKYNRDYPSQRHITLESLKILHTKELFEKMYIRYSARELAKILNVVPSTIYSYKRKYHIDISVIADSTPENEIKNWLNENNINFIFQEKQLIKPFRMDFFLTDCNIDLEFNGDFWHMNPAMYSENDINNKNGKTAKLIWEKDLRKKSKCLSNNIRQIVIWEKDWNEDKNQIKKKILQEL